MYKSGVILGFICLSFVASCICEEVNTLNCTRQTKERNPLSIVHTVNVSPCAAAPDGPCQITRGTNISISVEFTPKTKIAKKGVKHYYFWESAVDVQFRGIIINPCGTFMTCPARKNVRLTYSGILPTKANFPPSTYPVKIKIQQDKKNKTNNTITTDVIFCRIVKIKLV